MGIRETLAAHDARFVSFSELLKAVAEAENVTTQEAARAFSLGKFLSKVRHRLRDHDDGAYSDSDGCAAAYELELELKSDSTDWIRDAAESEHQRGEPGFFRDEIVVALAECGFAVPKSITSGSPNTALPTQVTQEKASATDPWLISCMPRTQIALSDAALILAGDDQDRVSGWYDVLIDAVDSGMINAGTWSRDRGQQLLSHGEIRAWCDQNDIVWPVPLPKPRSSTNAKCDAPRSEIDSEQLSRDLEKERKRSADLEGEGLVAVAITLSGNAVEYFGQAGRVT